MAGAMTARGWLSPRGCRHCALALALGAGFVLGSLFSPVTPFAGDANAMDGVASCERQVADALLGTHAGRIRLHLEP